MYDIFYNLQKRWGSLFHHTNNPQKPVESLGSLLNMHIPESHPADPGSVALEWAPGGSNMNGIDDTSRSTVLLWEV